MDEYHAYYNERHRHPNHNVFNGRDAREVNHSNNRISMYEQYDAPDEYNQHEDDIEALLYEIENSSPSPPERTQRARPFGQPAQLVPQAPARHMHDEYAHGYGPSLRADTSFEWPNTSHLRASDSDVIYSTGSYDAGQSVPCNAATISHRPPRNAYSGGLPVENSGDWPHTRLRPVSDLPDIYRGLFKFGVFNAVQSQCYDTVMNTDENMVVSAPTGSGKTVLFELAIVKMLKQAAHHGERTKCVYIAPTKSLCTEKSSSWETKFTPFGAKCSELTGDTVHSGRGAWGDAKDATIIVTTGEKWDSLTRNWQDHSHILSQIQLFLIDEVHLLNESRGSTLEVVVSRMKLRGSSVRFLVVSATVPNIIDVADWIGNRTNDGPALVKEFGEEYRPCKLSRFVYGVPRRRDTNDFVFAKALDYKLYGILQQHCNNKPVLVFCPTRKGVMTAAEHILKEYEEAIGKKETLPWTKPPRVEHAFSNKQLDKLAMCGIGVHHAGIGREDRVATEQLYLKKALKVLFATSTLAVGVNLPAHTVIIKGVKLFQNGASQEYSDLDVMQMIGRAGRPQFDKEGVAVIMCELELEAKYKALAQGQTILESSLHLHLPEHLNSEIALGTITDMVSAKEWLHNSFLFRRLQKNPLHYDIRKEGNKSWEQRMDDLVSDSVKTLTDTELVTHEDRDDGLSSTEYGDIMSKFYIRQATMMTVLKLPETASVREILEAISCADEFSDIKFRAGEKQVYNKLRIHQDIRFTLKKIEKPSDKVFILIQAILGAINLADPAYKTGESQPYTESLPILRHISRIARAIVEVAIMRRAGLFVKNALEVMRCLNAKAWEDRSVVFRQLDDIGLKSLKVLAENKVTTFAALRRMDPGLIEKLLNRKPPFGHEVLASVDQLPRYTVTISEEDMSVQKDGVEVELSIECGLAQNMKNQKAKKGKKQRRWDMTLVLTLTSDNTFVDFRRISTVALKESRTFSVKASLTKPSQTIVVYVTSDTYAGVTVSAFYKPSVNSASFPVMDTRPQDALARDLEGLEDMADFWDMSEDERGEPDEKIKGKVSSAHAPSTRSAISQSSTAARLNANTQSTGNKILTSAPKQLDNGNYECNHTCKDKTQCRHMCCRDGLAKPPPITKKRVEMLMAAADASPEKPSAGNGTSTPQKHTKQDARGKPKPRPIEGHKPAPTTADRSLKRLEALHERMGVEKSLHLGEGGRIKLKSETNSQRPPKPRPDFDLELTELQGTPSVTRDGASVVLSDSGSDSDLPEPRDVFGALQKSGARKKLSSDSVDYADPDFDALIANLPSSEAGDGSGQRKTHSEMLRPVSPTNDHSRAMDWMPGTPSQKRKSVHHIPESRKRLKVDHTDRSGQDAVSLESDPAYGEALFGSSLSDGTVSLFETRDSVSPATSCRAPALVDDEEGFTLDDSLFDIVPSTPAWTGPDNSTHLESPRMDAEAHCEYHAPLSSRLSDTSPKPTAVEAVIDDPIAELEAWLQSGSVVIEDE
ncbi:P-loop containing nucleoside triphosphate hydrolase protein [Trametes sanguinea]|nr:P-loop containing nucleoside triphosphate hydrolase protein [Trametes sanguinea]